MRRSAKGCVLQLSSKVEIWLLQPAVDLGVRSALWLYLWEGINLISSALKTGLAKAQAKFCREHLPQPCRVRQSLPLSLKSISQLAATAWKCPIINLWVFSLLVSRLFFFLFFPPFLFPLPILSLGSRTNAPLPTVLHHAMFSADTQELNMYNFHNTDYPCVSAILEGINFCSSGSRST